MSKGNHIYCFGEILWDQFGDFLHDEIPGKKLLGGAPFNIAAHLSQLGQKVSLISRVGEDADGHEILARASEFGVDMSPVQIDSTFATGTVKVRLNKSGSASYDIVENVAWDYIELSEPSNLISPEILVYGSLASRHKVSRDTLSVLLERSTLRVCDLNIRDPYYSKEGLRYLMSKANILKVDNDELLLLSALFYWDSNEIYRSICEEYGTTMIIKTMGTNGAELYKDGATISVDGLSIPLVDSVGGGDAFLAGFLDAYLKKQDLLHCLQAGNSLAAFVCSKRGAVPQHTDYASFKNKHIL